MSFALIHPPITALPTGGNIYNEHILQQACRHRFSLESIELSNIDKDCILTLNKTYGWLIWDSLFWESLAELHTVLRTSHSALLCHYLPSINPKINDQQRLYWRTMENRVLGSMRIIIVTGELIRNEIEQRFPGLTVEICKPGIDSAFTLQVEKLPVASSTTQLLTVANLTPEKGFLEILQSLSGLPENSWHWHICGCNTVNSRFTRHLWQVVAELGLAPNISYHGVLPPIQIAGLMRAADIFVAASYYESYGMALAEAATLRMPIISTATGAANEIVAHGSNGFLLQVGDIRAMHDYLLLLIENTAMRLKFSSRQHYRGQSWGQCFSTFRSICQQVSCKPVAINLSCRNI